MSPQDVSRFMAKIERGTDGECWQWTGAVSVGYGRFKLNRKVVLAHRVAYELLSGPIPDGLQLDHMCRNTRCVNPAHLEAVTHAENTRRKPDPPSLCPTGHPFDAHNTYVRPNGYRVCRACRTSGMRRTRTGRDLT